MMTREDMMDMVIAKFGFEADETIEFCRMCENGTGYLDCVCVLADLMGK